MYLLWLVNLFLLAIIFILYTNRNKDTYEINATKAKKLIKDGYFDVVIDVRTIEEWDMGHIPGTIHIPISNLVEVLPIMIKDKDANILFICQRGFRSRGVVEIAKKLGYSKIKSLKGSWSDLIHI